MPFAPVWVMPLSVRLVEPSSARVPLPDSLMGDETLALLRVSVPLWMSTAPEALLVKALTIVVGPLPPVLRIVPLLTVVCAAVQPQWLYQVLSAEMARTPPAWLSTSEAL